MADSIYDKDSFILTDGTNYLWAVADPDTHKILFRQLNSTFIVVVKKRSVIRMLFLQPHIPQFHISEHIYEKRQEQILNYKLVFVINPDN